MTTTPEDPPEPSTPGQPAQPSGTAQQPQVSNPGQPAQASEPGERPQPRREPGERGGCLTAAEIAELNRLGWEDPASEDDPRYFDDPDIAAPDWWLALPPAEQAREIEADLSPAPGVPEAIAAGFTHRYGGTGTGFEAGGVQDVMLPGGVLASEVGRVSQGGLKHLSDDALIGYLGASQELESWASANKHAAVLELDDRRAQPDGREGEHVAAEVGAALTLTRRSADALLARARELGRLEPVQVLLRNGIIDPRKADVLVRKLELLSDEHAALVLDRVLRRAGELTSAELSAACDWAIIAVDPRAAIRRREKAQKDARVETWTEDAGSAALAGRDLDPADVIAADQQLTADARWLKAHGVQGTIQQLRAKALTTRAAGQPLTCLLPPSTDTSATPDPAPAAAPASGPGPAPGALAGSVNLTMPASAWLGQCDNPGDIAGYGPADAPTCRDISHRLAAAGRATQWCLTLVDAKGRAVAHGCAHKGPPPGPAPPATGPPGTGPPDGGKIAWLAGITITPIATGTCDHQRESRGYRPPESLRHLIKIRSPRCGEPGCRTPARRADDDHTIAYHLGGKTDECNLYPLCRRSHRTKQAPGWHVTQPEPGVLIWTTPSGRTYTNITEPLPV